jgi:metal-sulfur cluster biosynthetic enzyme
VELGLIYSVAHEPAEGGQRVLVHMTLTAPGCGVGPVLVEDVKRACLSVPGVKQADVELVFDPPWDPSRMSEAARLQLGML